MPELSEKWLCKLIYGQSFGKLENEPLIFTLDIITKGNEFIGISTDIDGIGINPNPANVKGFIDGDIINFVKEYTLPVLSGTDQKNREEKKGPEISFTGCYDVISGEYSGEWIVISSFEILGTVFFEKNNGGYWSMQPETAKP